MKRVLPVLMMSLLTGPAFAQKFYPDDPLLKEPTLWPTLDPKPRALSSILEAFNHTFKTPGEGQPDRGVIPAGGVNTLGEVMNGPWFENRHGTHRLTADELFRGATNRPPVTDGSLRVLTVKKYGFRPGILVADSRQQIYLLRFDPRDWPEMATGAEVVASRIFHALGYHVPESYIVHVERGRLVIEEDAERVTSIGGTEDLEEIDLDDFLRDVAGSPERGYRAVATRMPETWEGYLGPYQVFGTRLDDPNDTVPHEHRRELRGLFVFSAWLNHFKVGAVNTLDVLETENGVPFIRHYLADFAAAFGSREVERKEAWQGNERFIDFARIPENIAGMGVRTPSYLRANYGGYRAVGRFEYSTFDPELWTPDSMIAPFANRLPDDTFWAAKQLAAFTDEDIRTLVSAGEYSDPAAEAWMVQCLIERKNRILATYFGMVLPLVDLEVREGALRFVDLAVERGFSEPRAYRYQWSLFDNETETHEPHRRRRATSPDVPDAARTPSRTRTSRLEYPRRRRRRAPSPISGRGRERSSWSASSTTGPARFSPIRDSTSTPA